MKNFTIPIIVFAALLMVILPVTSPAQDKKDARDNRDKAQQQMIELSKTDHHHQLLSSLAGVWNFTGKHLPPDPAKKPVEFKGTAERKAIMDGRYFIFETTGEALKMPWSDGKEVVYKDMIIEGYDNKQQKFVRAMIDNHWSTGITASEGLYDSTANTITYEFDTAAKGMKTKVQTRVKILDNDHYTVEIYLVNGDRSIKRTEINYTRKDAGSQKGIITPGEYHRMLARSNGKWAGKATVWLSPNAPPVDGGTSMLVNKMTADGLYQVSEIVGDPPAGTGKPWTGVRITGYDSERKVFTRAMIGDGNAAGAVSMEGRWDEATRSITMPFIKTDAATGRQRNLKEVYKIVDDNTEILEIYATDEKTGGNFKVLEVEWTRKLQN